jgi:hypothetical protein
MDASQARQVESHCATCDAEGADCQCGIRVPQDSEASQRLKVAQRRLNLVTLDEDCGILNEHVLPQRGLAVLRHRKPAAQL